MTTRETLIAARAAIVACGWAQGCYRNTRGQVCALGAIEAATGRMGAEGEPAAAALTLAVGGRLAAWNDAPGRTVEEVLSAFDRAIAATGTPRAT